MTYTVFILRMKPDKEKALLYGSAFFFLFYYFYISVEESFNTLFGRFFKFLRI